MIYLKFIRYSLLCIEARHPMALAQKIPSFFLFFFKPAVLFFFSARLLMDLTVFNFILFFRSCVLLCSLMLDALLAQLFRVLYFSSFVRHILFVVYITEIGTIPKWSSLSFKSVQNVLTDCSPRSCGGCIKQHSSSPMGQLTVLACFPAASSLLCQIG
jgi:hypothetical protein